MPSWSAMALRMKALLFGSLLRNSASSSSTLKATTLVLGDLRTMKMPHGGYGVLLSIYRRAAAPASASAAQGPQIHAGQVEDHQHHEHDLAQPDAAAAGHHQGFGAPSGQVL